MSLSIRRMIYASGIPLQCSCGRKNNTLRQGSPGWGSETISNPSLISRRVFQIHKDTFSTHATATFCTSLTYEAASRKLCSPRTDRTGWADSEFLYTQLILHEGGLKQKSRSTSLVFKSKYKEKWIYSKINPSPLMGEIPMSLSCWWGLLTTVGAVNQEAHILGMSNGKIWTWG